MFADYIIEKNCVVREKLTPAVMLECVRQDAAAARRRDELRESGKGEDEIRSAEFDFQVRTVDGRLESRRFSLGEIFKRTRKLGPLSPNCMGCAANRGEQFGCYGTLPIPFSRHAEQWLMDAGKRALARGGPAAFPFQFIDKQGITGERFAAMRKGDSLELERAFSLDRGGSPLDTFKDLISGRRAWNTNQILELLFDVELMDRPHMTIMLAFSGGLKIHESEPPPSSGIIGTEARQVLELTGEEGRRSWWSFYLPDEADDDDSLRALKEYFRAMFTALCENSGFRVLVIEPEPGA